VTLQPINPQKVIKALSYHGAFLKKHVISIIQQTPKVFVYSEEHPADFAGKTRTADIIAADDTKTIFVIECKKVEPAKSWIFFKATDQRYRVARRFNFIGSSSTFLRRLPSQSLNEAPPVCSEAYEYRELTDPKDRRAKRADQSPVFDAAGQLAGAFLGFVQSRMSDLSQLPRNNGILERYIPLLVTNARLFFIDAENIELDLVTGDVISKPDLTEVPRLILKQPAAAPRDFADFRTSIATDDEQNQRFHESIYVVNVRALTNFFSKEHRLFVSDTAELRAQS
jgi:hypothetical protein